MIMKNIVKIREDFFLDCFKIYQLLKYHSSAESMKGKVAGAADEQAGKIQLGKSSQVSYKPLG